MLKKRIIACLTVKGPIVVQSIEFKRYLPIGKPGISIEFLNNWGIDEIIILDIEATKDSRPPNFDLINLVSKKCFVPLTVGGGISSIEEMKKLIKNGADKISINTAAIKNPQLIKEASKVLGNQCIVVSIDVKKNNLGKYEIYIDSGKKATGLSPLEFAQKVEALGAGEIFLNSIERDGTKGGYDLELIKTVSNAVSIPVIACGGVGHPSHFLEGLKNTSVAAVAAGNYFHFTEHSPITTKAFLLKNNQPLIRLDTYAHYYNFSFDRNGRLKKLTEEYLEKLRFEYQPKEII